MHAVLKQCLNDSSEENLPVCYDRNEKDLWNLIQKKSEGINGLGITEKTIY